MKRKLSMVMALSLILSVCLLSCAAGEQGNALSFQSRLLQHNQKLAVFSGPGEDYYRASAGRALVSTNGKIEIAGVENGWILIYYRINDVSHRVGYISSRSLKDKLSLPEMEFAYAEATVNADCYLTDDPSHTLAGIASLKKSMAAQYLCAFNVNNESWGYIDVTVGKLHMRGFVPMANLTISPEYLVAE